MIYFYLYTLNRSFLKKNNVTGKLFDFSKKKKGSWEISVFWRFTALQNHYLSDGVKKEGLPRGFTRLPSMPDPVISNKEKKTKTSFI